MRVAVIVASILVMATPSQASKSCMSKTEARQHFASLHIYWHGQNHCWDAAPTRRLILINKAHRKPETDEVQRNIDRPKWHDSMSEMLPDDEPVQASPQTPWANRWVDIERSKPPLDARWVDIAQVKPSFTTDRKLAQMVTPHILLLVLITIAIALTLATIEFLFRRTID